LSRDELLRTTDGVADAHPERLARLARVAARTRERRRTAQPEVIGQVRDAWGLTIRDGFGQTETTAQVATRRGSRSNPARWAPAAPGDADLAPPRSRAVRAEQHDRIPRQRAPIEPGLTGCPGGLPTCAVVSV